MCGLVTGPANLCPHRALQDNECQVCECVMKFTNSEKKHIVRDHSEVPHLQSSIMSANMKNFEAQKSQKSGANDRRQQDI